MQIVGYVLVALAVFAFFGLLCVSVGKGGENRLHPSQWLE